MTLPTALITGITGQDGSYLGDFLLTQGDRVVGMVRWASNKNFELIENLRGNGIRKKSHFSRNVPPYYSSRLNTVFEKRDPCRSESPG